MKDTIKLILELIKMGKGIYKIYRKEKNASKKRKIIKALEKQDLVALRRAIFNRRPTERK